MIHDLRHPRWRRCALAMTLSMALGWPSTASAAQILEMRDSDTTIVRISLRDQTRIRVLDGRITDAFGDIFDASVNPGGRLTLTKDETDGELYVRPMPPTAAAPGGSPPAPITPVKLDIKSDRGTVALLLQPADVIGETVSLHIVGGAPRATSDASSHLAEAASSHERLIKALTLAMANPALAGGVAGRELSGGPHEVALWNEARFVLQHVLQAGGLTGETYELTNISPQRMVIDERELYRPGVLSVAVRRLVLEPGEATPVWIVRQPPAH